jgi:hypothetical protein
MGRNYNAGANTKRKRLASSGRNVEVQGGVIVEHAGCLMVRCHACGALAPVNRWWVHGTSEDPHIQGHVG